MKRFIAVVLVLSMLLALVGCGPDPAVTEAPTVAPTEPPPDAAQVYGEAVTRMESWERVTLDVVQKRNITVGIQSFEEEFTYELKYKDLGLDSFTANLAGTAEFGEQHSVTLDERYSGGAVYGFIGDFGYFAELDPDGFFSRYVPADMLDASLYDEVSFTDESTISFTGARDMEPWLKQEGFVLEEASGSATLNTDGEISAYTYDVCYTHGAVTISLNIACTVSDEAETVLPPDKHAADMEVFDASIPMMIERGYGYMLQSDTFTAITSTYVASDALALGVSSQSVFDLYYLDGLKMANSTALEIVDASTQEVVALYQDEVYNNGVYTVSEYGQEPQERPMTTAAIVEYAKQLKTGNYPRLENLEEMFISMVHGGVVIDYSYNDSYEYAMRIRCPEVIAGDPYIVERESQDYTPQLAEGYLALDIYTGLPTALSQTYLGAHTIDGEQYLQSMQVTMSLDMASLGAYSSITGEKLPVTEPVEEPTPAFYHVTGDQGQEMWLLGTIHIGDVRTQHLPQEIYDAFDSADALALEYDMGDFEARLEEDPQLAQQMYEQMLYLDGTTIADHLEDEELFMAAMQTMKMTGQLTNIALLMKPSMWSQMIENFYVRIGYQYSSDYGVDMQLMELANEQGKTILNVESGEEQMQLFSDYSDAVQQMLLMSSLSIDPLTYNAGIDEMFESWCAGDEEVLRQMLVEDTSQMTQEELAIYEEYTQAMNTDRDAHMLEVAKGYLESGETVFYAVGLAHLLAEEGLVNTLRQAGYTVEKVTYT